MIGAPTIRERNAHRTQRVGHVSRGFRFSKGRLRVQVQVTAVLDHVFTLGLDSIEQGRFQHRGWFKGPTRGRVLQSRSCAQRRRA